MEQLSNGYIELADLDINDNKKNTEVYKGKFALAHVHNQGKKQCVPHLNKLAVVSHALPVDPSCQYIDVPRIQEFGAGFGTL